MVTRRSVPLDKVIPGGFYTLYHVYSLEKHSFETIQVVGTSDKGRYLVFHVDPINNIIVPEKCMDTRYYDNTWYLKYYQD